VCNVHPFVCEQVTDRTQYGQFLQRATAQYKAARHAWFIKTLNVVFKENRKVCRPWPWPWRHPSMRTRLTLTLRTRMMRAQVSPRDLFSMKETQALAQSLDVFITMTNKVIPVGDANTL
jgi:hypothetical protein